MLFSRRRAGLIRWVTAVPLFVIHKQRRQAEKQKDDGTQKPKAVDLLRGFHMVYRYMI